MELTKEEKLCACGAMVTNIEEWYYFDNDKLVRVECKLFCLCGNHWTIVKRGANDETKI